MIKSNGKYTSSLSGRKLFRIGAIYFGAMLILGVLSLSVSANDPPHNADSSIECGECHGQVLFETDPAGLGEEALKGAYNDMCLRCHLDASGSYNANSGPRVDAHTSAVTKSTVYDFTTSCIDCHHPHYQTPQLWYGRKYYRSGYELAYGAGTSAPHPTEANRSLITYTSLTLKSGWTVAQLSEKTSMGRGAMLLPNRNSPYNSRIIESISGDESGGTITVKGSASIASAGFAIAYGQAIKRDIPYASSNGQPVIMLDCQGESSFAKNDGMATGGMDASPDGICQVCHENTSHWKNDGTLADHYSGQNCIRCHPHSGGFAHGGGGGTDCESCHGHADGFGGGEYFGTTRTHARHTEDPADDSGQPLACSYCHDATYPYFNAGLDDNGDGHIDLSETNICLDCHNQMPSWGAGACLSCHTGSVADRADVGSMFAGNSHHVQGIPIHDAHCYQCHWEGNSDGTINTTYHGGKFNTPQPVDLVINGVMSRPSTYDADGLNGDDTAIPFTASNMGGTLADERGEVENITSHCLGCHREENNSYMPFNDCRTPRQYAWDSSSIDDRYMDPATTTWGKYSGSNVAEKAIIKAYSAHGNAVNNGGGFSVTEGEDGNITNTRNGLGGTRNYNVECFDCHNSHGSSATGVTTSYITFTGYQNGGILKETQAGKGGYANAYSTSENTDTGTVNPYSQGAGLCFDCHDNSAVGAVNKTGSNTPWGYNDTFGATAPIMGYRDTAEFGQGNRGLNKWTSNNRTPAATILGGHLKPSSDLGGYDGVPGNGDEATGTINGLCTPCHDPHGVSPSLGDNMQYGLPLLKGTWVTSPYKEDYPGTVGDGYINYDHYQKYRGNYFYEGDEQNWKPPAIQKADGRGPGGWRTDRNTFNQADLSNSIIRPVGYDRITEGPEQFAGLCLGCHPKSSLTTDVSAEPTTDIAWTSLSRIHRSVQGWGWNDGDPEREHSFTCSKCHQPHISGLPRLMKTNCLNYTHRGQVVSGGVPQDPAQTADINAGGRFPFGWWAQGRFPAEATGICHGVDDANGSAGWPDNQGWNTITNW